MKNKSLSTARIFSILVAILALIYFLGLLPQLQATKRSLSYDIWYVTAAVSTVLMIVCAAFGTRLSKLFPPAVLLVMLSLLANIYTQYISYPEFMCECKTSSFSVMMLIIGMIVAALMCSAMIIMFIDTATKHKKQRTVALMCAIALVAYFIWQLIIKSSIRDFTVIGKSVFSPSITLYLAPVGYYLFLITARRDDEINQEPPTDSEAPLQE